jgi:hypothetical protein
MLFLDPDKDITYFLKRGNSVFESKRNKILDSSMKDKFIIFANWYETNLTCSELKKEFESCGYNYKNLQD